MHTNIQNLLHEELQRQRANLSLIASENYASRAVLEATGSVLMNKYAEGYPGKRYYGGNAIIDEVENLAIARAKKLFKAEHVNVQPLSGAPANIAVYAALLEPGDTVLGMDLSHGGHLTHGHPVTWMAKLFTFVRYKTKPDGLIDFDEVHTLAKKHKPKLILAGYSAYSRTIDWQQFKTIADEVGAYTMADIAHIAGLVAAGVMENPVPLFDVVTTTTHKTLRGPRGAMIFCKREYASAIDKAVFPGLQGGPHENTIAGLAVALDEASQPSFRSYAERVLSNARTLCATLANRGFTICFGRTENHLIVTDVTPLGRTGQEAQSALERVRITVNKNMVPDDTRKPTDPSGIRLGTPAATTRGLRTTDMETIGNVITDVLQHPQEETVLAAAETTVNELCTRYPLYPELS